MGIQRFIDLWKHRYNKYILQQYVPAWRFIQSYLLVRWVKLNNPKKQIIGVLLAEHFGDIVAAEPLSRIIKQKYPDSKVFGLLENHLESSSIVIPILITRLKKPICIKVSSPADTITLIFFIIFTCLSCAFTYQRLHF
jgi:heptosyltransferase-3